MTMWYVLTEDGIYGEYEKWEEAEAICDRLNSRGEDAWIASDECEEYEEEPFDLDLGFDPYMGGYSWDC